jgi:hypothetical protein
VNAMTNRLSPNITTTIRLDHTHVFALFHRYKADGSANRKRALIRNACLALEVHAQLEEEIFYPALSAVLGPDDVLAKSGAEHEEMRRLIGELRGRTSEETATIDASCDDVFFELMRSVMHHVADEESRLLPAAERLLGDRLGELGSEMTKRRIELLRPHAGELATSAVRSFSAEAALLTVGAIAAGAMLWSLGRSSGGTHRLRR